MTHWHARHKAESSLGGRIADAVVAAMGSWTFIILQTVVVTAWIAFNFWALILRAWDPYPFILLNLVFSTQAAYASPLILMASNRAAERDRAQAQAQYEDTKATHEIAAALRELIEVNNRLTEEIHRLVVGRE